MPFNVIINNDLLIACVYQYLMLLFLRYLLLTFNEYFFMSFPGIPSTSSTNISASTAQGTSSSNPPSSSGLSSVGSSISSETCRDFFSCILSSFKAAGKFFSDTFSKIAWFVHAIIRAREDAATVAFIKEKLGSLDFDANALHEAKEQFAHIFHPKLKLELIKLMLTYEVVLECNPPRYLRVSPETATAFYALLDVNTQRCIEEHIFIANGKNDNGEGTNFGRNVINRNIKSELVIKAIESCLFTEDW